MNIDYSNMTEEQLSLIYEYCKDDMRKLKQICYLVWGCKGVPNCYHDDLYDDAMNVLSESVLTYNPDGGANFKTYLLNNIHLSYGQWYRDTHLRAKRNNLALDKNGKIKKDANGNPIIIHNVSLDEPNPEYVDLIEKLPSSKTVESEVFKDDVSDNIRKYLENLSTDQRKVAELIMDGYSNDGIMLILHMNHSEFNNCMNGLRSYRKISILF